jgi:C1A family cysteine protease
MKAGVSTFYSYGGGVYNGYPSGDPNNIDHAVTIVGWYEPWKAWIIKNSWGTGWGPYGGYAYVNYNASNIGKWIYWVYPNP